MDYYSGVLKRVLWAGGVLGLVFGGYLVYVFGFGVTVTKEQLSYTRNDGVVGFYPNYTVGYRLDNILVKNALVDWLIGIR